MTDLQSADRGDWIKRLSPAMHHVAILITGLLLVFSAGAVVGFVMSLVKSGAAPSLIDGAILATLATMTLALAWLSWRLTAIWRRPGRSAFEQRYTRMWLVVIALGLPGGLALGYLGDSGSGGSDTAGIFSNEPIAPWLALVAAAVLGIGLILATILYHRTVDEVEERAYLWGSSVAFHFLVTAVPVAWLLARGGWIAPLGTAAIGIILLVSVTLQAAVFLWLKYR